MNIGNYHCKNCEHHVFDSENQYNSRSGYASFRAAAPDTVILGEKNATKQKFDNVIETQHINPNLEYQDVHCIKVKENNLKFLL